jgi:prephenate dehydrogenase
LKPGVRTPNIARVLFKKVTLVGVGLLGGSLGLALKQRRLAVSVAGFVRRAASVKECERAGAVDLATRDLHEVVAGADLIVLCTPIAQMRALVQRMLPSIEAGAIVTDVGSVKASVVSDLESLVTKAGAHFVGSHPMAGAEKTGVAWARADLFTDAVCVITPTPNSNRAALRHVEQLWKAVGARLLRLTPDLHDELVGRSSHLPHVLAAQLANSVLDPTHPKQQALLCANGFRDTTRIASGSPEMWRDIALANRDNLLSALRSFEGELARFKAALKKGDSAAVSRFFQRAKRQRDQWSRKARSTSPE